MANTRLLYRKGGTACFKWLPVLATADELPAKRMALFVAGYATIILDANDPAPTKYDPPGAWAGIGPWKKEAA